MYPREETKIPITTTISKSMHEDCKKRGLSWQSIFIRGYEAYNEYGTLTSRMNDSEKELKKENERMARNFSVLQTRIFDLMERLEKYEKKSN